MNTKKVIKKLNKLLESENNFTDETKNILNQLVSNGFKDNIFSITKKYNVSGEVSGADEDGYPEYDTYYDYITYEDETDTYDIQHLEGTKLSIKPELEENRIRLGEYGEDDSGDYPTGLDYYGNVTYSDYFAHLITRYYFRPVIKEDGKTNIDFILQNYPNSELARLIKTTGMDKVNFSDEEEYELFFDDFEHDLTSKDFV